MEYTVNCLWDESADVWVATSEDIPGLVLESGSLDALMEKVRNAAPEIILMNNLPAVATICYKSERVQRVYA